MIVAIAEDEQAHTPNKVAIAEQGQEVKRSNASHAPSVNSGELLISKSVVMPDVLGKESWEPLVKVRGKTIPVTMPHMLLFVSLLLASAASRLEIYPRAQIYTDLIHYAHMPSWWDQQDCDQMINTGTGDLGAGAHTSCRTGDSLMGAYAITAIAPWFTAAWWAAISDKVGRKPILVLSTVGVMITKIPILVVLVLGDDRIRHVGAGRAILGLGSVFHSVLGGFLTNTAVSLVYLVDTTTPWNRTIVIALGLAALYIGNFIGASIGHSMSSEIIWTFITALIMQAVYVLYVATILPESLGAEKRQEPKKQPLAVQSEKTGNELAKTVGRILIPVAVFLPIRVGHGDITIQRPGSKWDSNVFLLSVAFGVGAMMMDGAYFLGHPTIWSPDQGHDYAYWFIPRHRTYPWKWYPLVRGLVILVMTPGVIAIMRRKPWQILVNRLFPDAPQAHVEEKPLRVGSSSGIQKVDFDIARFTIFWTVFLQSTLAYVHPQGLNEKVFSTIGSFGALFMPTLISLISVLYTNNGERMDVGRLMGGLMFIQAALGQGLGKLIFVVIYEKLYTNFIPGAYYLATVLMAFLLVVFYHVKLPNQYFY